MRLLVTGGTGHLGRKLVWMAQKAGHDVTIASRRSRPPDASTIVGWATTDLSTGEGLLDALREIDAVVHCASDPANAAEVDVRGMTVLTDAARRTGLKHLIYVSIVGVDKIPFSYYGHKYSAEKILEASGMPYSILRAAQFHFFIDYLLERAARIPLFVPIPAGFRVQSVATEDVVKRLLSSVESGPGGRLRDFAGPEVLTIRDAASVWKRERLIGKPLLAVPLPGSMASAFRDGNNTAPDGDKGTITWQQWLEHSTRPR